MRRIIKIIVIFLSLITVLFLTNKIFAQTATSLPVQKNASQVLSTNCNSGIVEDDGSFENGYGWNCGYGWGRWGMKVAPWFNNISYPYTITHICVALTRTGDTANWTFNLNFYDTTGSYGGPGVLVDSIPNLTATNIGIWPNVTWHSFDSLTGIPALTNGSYIICLSYDPCTSSGRYVAADEYGPNPPMPIWGYMQGVWSQFFGAHGHLGIRAEQNLVGVSGNSNEIPKKFKLYVNYPNPFNPTSTIKFDVPNATDVKIVILNILGQEITTLVNGHFQAGSYSVTWDGTNYPSGVYFYKIEVRQAGSSTGNYTDTKKMLLVK